MKVYRIRNWDQHFEKSQTRKVRHLEWVAVPTKHDGRGYRRLMREPDGPALYGAWILILTVAARAPVRGVLADQDGPFTAEDISLKTDAPAEVIDRTLSFLTEVVGWIEIVEVQDIAELVPPTVNTPSTLPARSQCTGSTLPARSQHAPSTLPAHSQHTPSTLPADAKSEQTTSSDDTGSTLPARSQHAPSTLPARWEHGGTQTDKVNTDTGPDRTGPSRACSVSDTGSGSGSGSGPGSANGRLSGRRGPGPDQGSLFAGITPEVLRDTRRLHEWFVWQASSPRRVLPSTRAAWIVCVAAAEESLSWGLRPAARFATILGRRHHDKISAGARQRALDRIREFEAEGQGDATAEAGGG